MSKTIIVGAGLAGLTAAHYLQSAGIETIVLEAGDKLGGRVQSDLIDGYICDRGFQVINPGYREIVRMKALDGIDFKQVSPTIRLVDQSDLLVGLSNLPSLFTAATGSPLEKIGFASFLASSPQINKSFGESAASFPKLYANVLRPFLAGVFLSNPDLLSSGVAREIIRSFVLGRPGVPAHGVGEFSQALAARVTDLRLNSKVSRIGSGEVRGEFGSLSAENIIVATDMKSASHLLDRNLNAQSLPSTTWYHTTSDGIARSKYMAVCKAGPIINSIVISEVSHLYAPAGRHLIATTTLADLKESEVRRELERMWGADTSRWELVAHYEIENSLSLSQPGEEWEKPVELSEGLYLIGDYRNLPSQQGAMRSGRLAAEAIIGSRR